MSARPVRLDIYRTAIPMRTFEHAAAKRDVAEAVVTRVTFDDGGVGWGETLPRPYVTGETIQSVVHDLQNAIWPACRGLDVADGECLAALDKVTGGQGCMNAARCAFELTLVDCGAPMECGGHMECGGNVPKGRDTALDGGHRPDQTARLSNVMATAKAASHPPSADLPPHSIAVRISGVLGSADPAGTARRLRLMRLYGLRDFKLKLGFGDDIDAENLRVIQKRIGKAIAAGKCSLRVDVNGGWDAATTLDRVEGLKQFGICVVEQPVYCSAVELVELARWCALPLMADESLLTYADAQVLAKEPQQVWWNIRISKNGGLSDAFVLAAMAKDHGIPFSIGCMVGESSILSAAQRRLLQMLGPWSHPRFVEGNYGRFLLADDLTTRSIRFGYGGRLKPLKGPGFGVTVDPAKLAKYGTLVKTLEA